MDALNGEISALIFRQVVRNHHKDFSLDRRLLEIFLELDGKKTLGTIAGKKGLNMVQMRTAIERLIQLDLIEPAEIPSNNVDFEFMEFLIAQFSKAIGPIARVLIEDEIVEMGYSAARFPCSNAAELVDLLSREIKREDKKTEFQTNLVRKIKERGY
jgi:hypothetical protein